MRRRQRQSIRLTRYLAVEKPVASFTAAGLFGLPPIFIVLVPRAADRLASSSPRKRYRAVAVQLLCPAPQKSVHLKEPLLTREFDIAYPGGRRVNIAFTLARTDHACPAAAIARSVGAIAFGLVSAIDSTDTTAYPMYWFFNGKATCIVPADSIRVPPKALRATVASLIQLFFADIAAETPELAFLLPGASDMGSRTLH
jgi:hypothetical protein